MVDWTRLADRGQILKNKMERIWNSPNVAYANYKTCWREGVTSLSAHKGERYPPVKSPWRRPASRGLTKEGLRILRHIRNQSTSSGGS